MGKEIILRYGCNPHQIPAKIYSEDNGLPLKVLNGAPGYINLLDALNSWQLVRELREVTNLPAAASFKHVSPAGAALGIPLSKTLAKAYFVEGIELSPLAAAYARARGADRVSSFGDWVALSDPVDLPTARLLKREVSDGIIAPGYDPEALALLREKKKGRYNIIQIDPAYEPPEMEIRQVFGVFFAQKRNDLLASPMMTRRIVTENRDLPASAERDLLLAMITLKYTQSNSVCLAVDGQVIGVGAGQQSRIHCTRLAAAKADTWYLRQHPKVLELPFREGISRPERDNAIDQYLREDLTAAEKEQLRETLAGDPPEFTAEEKRAWLANLREVALASDGFFPFRDNIDRAHASGVKYIVQPGGSVRDQAVIAACNEYGMVMAFSGVRLFHH